MDLPSLARRRRRRLKEKAAPAPSSGRGAGTAGGPTTTLMVSPPSVRVQLPIRPVVVKPSVARVVEPNVALLKSGEPGEYVEGRPTKPVPIKVFGSPMKVVAMPETDDARYRLALSLKEAGPVTA